MRWLAFTIACVAAEVYVAPSQIARWGLNERGMAMYIFDVYDRNPQDGVLGFEELSDFQADTNPDLPLTWRDYRYLVRAFRTGVDGLPPEHLVASYFEPWRSRLGTDAEADFRTVFALTSRAVRAE